MSRRAVMDATAARGTPRRIVTPEGVELEFILARAGDRLGAFLLDFLLILVLLIAVIVVAVLAVMGPGGGDWLLALVLLVVFLLQNFYFIYFESRGRGMTPGKRRVGIRVMEANGGTLTGSAIVVRNVLRNLEVWIPMLAILAPQALWPAAPGWARVLASVWLLVIAGMPLFNKRRLRVGDMVAGTIVVVAPEAVLLHDLGRDTKKKDEPAEPPPRWPFTEKQLDVYGEYELQVLEDLLRTDEGAADQRKARRAVADRIAKKIRWEEKIPAADTKAFLLEFYKALRGRLEQRMLFGKRKKDKFSKDA